MLNRIAAARVKGYKVHSCKIGGENAHADIDRVRDLVRALPSEEKITFDVNRAWTPSVAIQVMNSGAAGSTFWFEQPCETLAQCIQVRQKTTHPIMLDECLTSFDEHLTAYRAGACEGIKVKPNRLGGLTKARQIRDFGVSVGWQMHIEDVGGTVLADTAAIHLAQSTPADNRLASWLSHEHLVSDPAPNQGARNKNGATRAPALPGIGVDLSLEVLGEPIFVLSA